MEWPASRVIAAALRPRGAARRLSLALNKDQSTITRWAHGARPDPTLWPGIEHHLGLAPGTLNDASRPGDDLAELRDRVAQLEQSVLALLRLAAKDGAVGRSSRHPGETEGEP